MKKFTAILLSLTTVFTLAICGCNKTESENTGITAGTSVTEISIEASSSEETLSAKTTLSFEEAELIRAGKLIATRDDFICLESVVRSILFVNLPRDEYDSSADVAFQDAMYMIYNSGMHLSSGICKKEVDSESHYKYGEYASSFVADPLDKFSDIEDAVGYIKVDAEDVDWILENVLGVTPDRTKTSDDFDYSDYPNFEEYYYHDGYYYYSVHDGGGGGGSHFRIIGFRYNRDGSYTARFTTFDRESESEYTIEDGTYYGYSILEATASLMDVDGERVWLVSNAKSVEYIDQERIFY